MMTEEQKKLVEENHNLIYFYLHKRGLSIDEYYGLAAIGLCKAAITYKDSISEFSTYALKCISNEVGNYFRNYFRTRTIPDDLIVSLQDIILDNGNDEPLTYERYIPDNINVEDEVIARISVNKVLSNLTDQERQILLLHMDGMRQMDIANHIGISRARVSRTLRGLIRRIIES